MASSAKVIPISPPMILGEGPHWDEKNKSLYFVDYVGGTINRFFPESQRHDILNVEGSGNGIGPSMMIPIESNEDAFVVGIGHDLVLIEWPQTEPVDTKAKPSSVLCTFDLDHPRNSVNDAKCDPSGRLWAGTKGFESADGKLDSKKGGLYTMDQNLKTNKKVSEVTLSNGLTWSNDAKTFYYIDTPTLRVDAFDYDDSNGQISNRRVVYDLEVNGLDKHYPDGMTIDSNGHLWVACYNGGKVLNIDPNVGKLITHVSIPSIYTTSCCFGGPDYSTLYVTSGTRGMSDEQIKISPDSGKTFAVTGLGVKGTPHRRFNANSKVIEELLKI